MIELTERVAKPVTFARVRFWQTSRGFYTGPKLPVADRKPQVTWGRARTVRNVLEDRNQTVQVVARDTSGNYLQSQVVRIIGNIRNFWNLTGFDVMEGGACGLGFYSYMIPPHRITTDLKTKCLLLPLLNANRLTLRKARFLRSQGETLQKC